MITRLQNVKVFITGIAGFTGSHLARRLLAEGAEVHGLARIPSNLWRIQDLRDQIALHYSDLRDYDSVRKIVQSIKPEKVYHLAAYVNVRRAFELIDEMIEVNIRGTINLLKALDWNNFDCFINTGSSEEYGDSEVPFREQQIPNPVSPYSAAKVSATMFCQMLQKVGGANIIVLRPFLTYGPWQGTNMLIPSLIMKTIEGEPFLMTEGSQTREFNYIDDIIDGYIKASITPKAVGEIINLGNGLEYKVIDVVRMVLKLMNSQLKPEIGTLPYRLGEARNFYCDNAKAKEILNWQPRINLEQGLITTINWFRMHYT